MLFEVSNETRHNILEELNRAETTVTKVAENLGISMTEASRHFNRLSEIRLIEKTTAGSYKLSMLGGQVLRQLSPLDFTMKHVEYFRDRDLSHLPDRFIVRLHELSFSAANYLNKANIMNTARTMTRVFSEARSYVYYILDDEITELILYRKPEEESVQRFNKQIQKGVNIKFLFPESFDMDLVHSDMFDMHRRFTRTGRWETRLIKTCDIFLHMSEKEIAVLSFPDRNGIIDYLGFEGNDESTLDWCNDVFNYYWNNSKPVNIF